LSGGKGKDLKSEDLPQLTLFLWFSISSPVIEFTGKFISEDSCEIQMRQKIQKYFVTFVTVQKSKNLCFMLKVMSMLQIVLKAYIKYDSSFPHCFHNSLLQGHCFKFLAISCLHSNIYVISL
jgi:hypothetical protein